MVSLTLVTLLTLVASTLSAPIAGIQKRALPDYVYKYAPIFYLHSQETYFPTDLTTFLANSHPETATGTRITPPAPLTLANLDSLNAFESGGTNVWLASNEGIRALPAWFRGTRPGADSSLGTSRASAIITVPKANGVVDAFYFTFFAYNQGNRVLNLPALEFGDHVGDWEHVMIRFVNGAPTDVWYSQHAEGQAFAYRALEKEGLRPRVYIARGTHANFAIGGTHDHTLQIFNLPVGPLVDYTDRGVRWDASVGAYEYQFDAGSGAFSSVDGAAPTGWLGFAGRWGDRQLPDDAEGQVNVFGARKYTGGPTGPRDKKLVRTNVCPPDKNCLVWPVLVPKMK